MNTMNESTNKKLAMYGSNVIFLCMFLAVIFFSNNSHADSLKSYVDRQKIEMGDIINLTVQTDFQTLSKPDFSILQDQFEILAEQRSSQINMVNGSFESYTRWDVRLTPKQLGELIIPPFKVADVTSNPVTIKVAKATAMPSQHGASFFEASVNQLQAYVQQQMIYTLRFYHLGSLVRGSTRPPVFKDAISKPLTKQVNYQKSINGNNYEVYEWSWAFYPQKSGELIIEPQVFNGQIRYNARTKRINQFSKAIKLNIKPIPSSYPKQELWLPATNVELLEDWQHNKTVRVGDSITRTLQIQANSLLSSQLPTIELEQQIEFHHYPDQPILEDKKTNNGFRGKSTRKIAIVPTSDGKLVIPSYQVHWWNTTTDSLAVAQLPVKTINILPALQSKTAAKLPILSVEQENANNDLSKITNQTEQNSYIWQLVSLFFALLWLGTLYWFFRKRTTRQAGIIASQTTAQDTAKANTGLNFCQTTDAKVFYQQLNLWLQQQENEAVLKSLIEENFNQLQSHLFNEQKLAKNCLLQICNSIEQFNVEQSKLQKSPSDKLESLYL